MTDASIDEKRMKLRYAGVCRVCEAELPARTEAVYERATKTVRCVDCPPATHPVAAAAELQPDSDLKATPAESVEPTPTAETMPPPSDVAGSSARREYERRKANDEAKIREKWGRLGGIAVALSDEKQSTKAWQQGAIGEEKLGARLDGLVADGCVVLHDRRIPGTRANIDHIVIAPSGIWVIDAKRYKGRPELRVEGGIFRPRTEKLIVGGRDRTSLVEGMLKQIEHTRSAAPETPIIGALCFVEADWPLIGGSFRTREVKVLWPKLLIEQIRESSDVGVDIPSVAAILTGRFKPS